MEVCSDHGEEELLTTDAGDGAEENVFRNSINCIPSVFDVSKCDKQIMLFFY